MRIVCPACGATYEVPEAMLKPAGRAVRCARCGQEWDPASASPLPPPQAPAASAISAAQPLDAGTDAEIRSPGQGATRQPPLSAESRLGALPLGTAASKGSPASRRHGAAARIAIVGWLLTALILGGALVAAWRWRPQFEAAWPPVRRVYLWLGLS